MTGGRHRINQRDDRRLNAPIYHTVIVRMRFHELIIAYVTRSTAEGKSKCEIIRCSNVSSSGSSTTSLRSTPRTSKISS